MKFIIKESQRKFIIESLKEMDDEELDANLKTLSPEERIKYSEEIKLLKQTRDELKTLYKNHGKDIKALKYLEELKKDLDARKKPKVYLGLGKHHSTGLPFIIGRTVFKPTPDKKADLSVYVGPLSRFEEGIESPEAMNIAVKKMIEKIEKKFPYAEKEFDLDLIKHIHQMSQKQTD
jgi:hypothetical protein